MSVRIIEAKEIGANAIVAIPPSDADNPVGVVCKDGKVIGVAWGGRN